MNEQNKIVLMADNNSLSVPVGEMVTSIKDRVYAGELDAVDVGIALKKMKKLEEELFEDKVFKSHIYDETKKSFEGKTCIKYGASISERATSTYYDFKITEDPIWLALNEIQEQVKSMLKTREEGLKAMIPDEKIRLGIVNNNRNEIIEGIPKLIMDDTRNGEVVTIKPPIKYQSVGLVYSKL